MWELCKPRCRLASALQVLPNSPGVLACGSPRLPVYPVRYGFSLTRPIAERLVAPALPEVNAKVKAAAANFEFEAADLDVHYVVSPVTNHLGSIPGAALESERYTVNRET